MGITERESQQVDKANGSDRTHLHPWALAAAEQLGPVAQAVRGRRLCDATREQALEAAGLSE
jgi:hypothetical protein